VLAGSAFPELDWSGLLLTVPLGVLLLALQLPVSFALARGERPDHLWWRLLALAATVYVPLPWLASSWWNTEVFLVASFVLMQRRARVAVAIVAVWLLVREAVVLEFVSEAPAAQIVLELVYIGGWSLSWLGALVGSVLVVRTLDELHASRSRLRLARVAVERERVRLSRDLHDLLGQSLSAVSLKGHLGPAPVGQ